MPSYPQIGYPQIGYPQIGYPGVGPSSLGAPIQRRQPRRRPTYNLTPEEEESLLGKLGQNALSGLGTVAHTLGKPGAAVRGTISGLTGGPWGGGLLNLIPFSNTLGITDPKKWVYSRDIMRRHGMMGKKNTWGNFGVGLAADIVTDPLAWVSFGAGGAATKAGQLLHRAGLSQFLPDVLHATAKTGAKALGPRVGGMATTLDDFVKNLPEAVRKAAPGKIRTAAEAMKVDPASLGGQPLRGLMGVHAPLMPSKQIGLAGRGGPVSQAIGSGMDWLGGKVRYSAPVRGLVAGFAPSVRGLPTEAMQRTGAAASRLEAFKAATSRETLGGYLTKLNETGALKTGDEGIQDAMAMRAFMESKTPLPTHLQGKGVESILGKMNDFAKVQLAEETALGMATKDLNETFNYVTRYSHKFGVSKGAARGFRELSPLHPSQKHRMEFFKGVSSDPINKMSIDPALSGTLYRAKPASWAGATGDTGVDISAATAHIRANYGDAVKHLPDNTIREQAKWLSELDPQHAAGKIPIFPHHPVFDVVKRDEFSKRAVANTEVTYDLLGKEAKHFSEAVSGERPLLDVLEAAGLTGNAAPSVMLSRLSPDTLNKIIGAGKAGTATKAILKDLRVPKDIEIAITNMNRGFSSPEWMEGFVKQFDNFTNFFRAHVTTYFPAFINRNLVSGQLQNAFSGVYGAGGAGMYRAMRDAQILLGGKGTIPGVLEFPVIKALGITDPKEATRKIAELAFAHKLGGKMQMEAAQHLGGQVASGPVEQLGMLPGLQGFKPLTPVKKAMKGETPDWWNPLKVRGVGKTTESQFLPSQLGEEAGYWVESMNRLGPFTEMLRKGIDPAKAAQRIKLLQVDYTAAASGDAAMRRMIPFWAFLKGQSQFLAKELTTHPGGALSQVIQAESRSHEQLPAFTPPYVQTSAALPGSVLPEAVFGKPAPDTVRAMTGLGLMHEDPLQFLSMDPRKPLSSLPMNVLREGMGRMNPLFQRPVEAATGVSLFKSGPRGGRSLDNMDPALARLFGNVMGRKDPVKLPWGAETLAQFGAPRLTTTLKTATETPERKNIPTKLLNLLTGARVTDVSPRARESQMREAIQDLQTGLGGRAFEVRWIPKDIKAKMTEEEKAKAANLELLSKILGERAKRRASRPVPDPSG